MRKLLLIVAFIPYIIDFKFGGGTPLGCWHFDVNGPGGRSNLANLVKWTCSSPKPTEKDILIWKAEYDMDPKGKKVYEALMFPRR